MPNRWIGKRTCTPELWFPIPQCGVSPIGLPAPRRTHIGVAPRPCEELLPAGAVFDFCTDGPNTSVYAATSGLHWQGTVTTFDYVLV